MVRNFRKPADRDFEMLRFFGLRGCMNYDLGFLCLTRPAFTRLPWRITPCPCVHAWASLAVFIILTASKPCEIRIANSRSAGFRKFLTLWCNLKNQNMQALGLHILECWIFFILNYSSHLENGKTCCLHASMTHRLFLFSVVLNSYFTFILHSLVACT